VLYKYGVEMTNTTSDVWSKYWQQGYKTSFGSMFSDNYEGVIAEHWQRMFVDYSQGSTVLDLCTGNASLIYLAKDKCPSFTDIKWVGVDYATIQVKEDFNNIDNVDLLEQVDIEDLTALSQNFEHVISNFGLEYSDLEKSIPSLSKVIKKNGHLALMCHLSTSVLIKNSAAELLALEQILNIDGVMEQLKLMLVHKAKENSDAEKYRAKLNEQLASLYDEYGNLGIVTDFISFLKYVLSAKLPNKVEQLNDYKSELVAYQTRLSCMCDAALNEEKKSRLKELLTLNGFVNIAGENIYKGSDILGYCISAQMSK